jgi:hypothetical protein
MPDPALSDALLEAYAVAPADDLIFDTLEVRHPLFVDAGGNPDSAWLVANDEAILARIEADAALKAGQLVEFLPVPFRFSLAPVEPGAVPEIEVTIDNAGRVLVAQLDRAVTTTDKITLVYRPYLQSGLLTGPEMDPPPSFELASVQVDLLKVTARARVTADLRGAFPRRLYTAADFPGLIGR